MKTDHAPIIFEYLDASRFLHDHYLFRKRTEKHFSFESWAEQLGFRSRSYLRMTVIGKKKISTQFCEKFSKANQLSEKEGRYFEVLCRYTQAGTQIEKDRYGRELIEILKTCSVRKVVSEAIEFLSKPLYTRLLVMLGFRDIIPTVATFAKLLDVPVDEMSMALRVLEDLKLATSADVDGEKHWHTSNINFDVPQNLGSVPMMRFHEQSLQHSIAAFHLPKELRRYQSLIVPLNESEVDELYALIEDFTAKQLARFQSNEYQGRRLFQMNLNVFAVSEPATRLEDDGERSSDSAEVNC